MDWTRIVGDQVQLVKYPDSTYFPQLKNCPNDMDVSQPSITTILGENTSILEPPSPLKETPSQNKVVGKSLKKRARNRPGYVAKYLLEDEETCSATQMQGDDEIGSHTKKKKMVDQGDAIGSGLQPRQSPGIF